MLNAKEAKTKSMEALYARVENELNEICDLITESCELGLTACIIQKELHELTIKRLIDENFKVNFIDENKTVISW